MQIHKRYTAGKQQVTIKHTALGQIVKLLGKVPKTICADELMKASECIKEREYKQIQIPKANDQNRNESRDGK